VSGGGASGVSGASGGGGGASGGGGGGGRTYTTHFPLTENPISEGGNWINGGTTGLDWHDVSTIPGLAIGHQSGTSYTDGTALLTGAWGPTQSVEAVVHTVKQHDSCYQEVEMRLRSALSPHSCTGYEISFKMSKTSAAYLIIVRWNGKLGDFTYLKNVMGAQYGVSDGDTVKATISGNVITAYLNGVVMATATDGTFTTGSPGMGFNLETGDPTCVGTNGDYGFTSLTATGK
jgi:hypothetical protein